MIPLGVHVSIAGGVSRAPARAAELGCTAMQIFVKNASRWSGPGLSEAESAAFREELPPADALPVVAHAAYLINLAAGDGKILAASIAAMVEEMSRCRALGIPWLVLHPGSHGGAGEGVGVARAAASLDAVFASPGGEGVRVALETTAGQGNALGATFEQLAAIRDRSAYPGRIGFAFDTCHVFAAGYDIRGKASFSDTWRRFDDLLGIASLAVIHLNDSLKGLGSRVDRHTHIGEGGIGIGAFRLLMNDDPLRAVPKILETPKEKDGRPTDAVNLGRLRRLVRGAGR